MQNQKVMNMYTLLSFDKGEQYLLTKAYDQIGQ